MSLEAAVVISHLGRPSYWHLPPGRSAGYLPDSLALWEAIWEDRERIYGIAHSHPGIGLPGPSQEDLTTFASVEQALGKRLVWWITSEDTTIAIEWQGPGRLDYTATRPVWDESRTRGLRLLFAEGDRLLPPPAWLETLRQVSYGCHYAEQYWPFRGASRQAEWIANCFSELAPDRRELLTAKIEAAILAEVANERDGFIHQPGLLKQIL